MGKAFEEGVKQALKFFSKPTTREAFVKGAEALMKRLVKHAR